MAQTNIKDRYSNLLGYIKDESGETGGFSLEHTLKYLENIKKVLG